jgi:hypothetical protein
MNEFEEIEDWIGGFLNKLGDERIRSRATQGLEILDEAYSLPWWRLITRKRLLKKADRLWR